jgi:hypothetical protein
MWHSLPDRKAVHLITLISDRELPPDRQSTNSRRLFKHREQRSWFTRTGADTVERRRRRLLAQKTAIEHQLMELMTSPVGGFAAGEPAFNS